MSTLEYTVHNIRRGWRVSRTFIFAGAFAAAVVAGAFSGLSDPSRRILPLALFAAWTLAFVLKARKRFAAEQSGCAISGQLDLELGLLLVVATHAIVQIAGGSGSAAYPLIFVLVAFFAVYTAHWIGFALVASAIGIEYSMALWPYAGTEQLITVTIHSIFIVIFALINMFFTRSEIVRTRRRAETQMEKVKTELEKEALDFRLTAPASGQTGSLSRQEESERISMAAVGQVRNSMYQHVSMLKQTMELHTCLLLWLDARQEKLRILECVSEADNITREKIEKGAGALGAILQGGKPLRLKGLRPGYPGLPYYEGGSVAVTDFLGVPVMENGSLRGVLCTDRISGRQFQENEAETLLMSAESMVGIIANERVFTQLQKAKSEQGKLLAASDKLSSALSEKEVVKAAIEAAGQITNFDIAAVTLVDDEGRQVVKKALGENVLQLEGLKFKGGTSLACAALKNRHYLPHRGVLDPKQQIVFTKKVQKHFEGMNSALVLPLVAAGDTALGTLTLASEEKSFYSTEVRTTLQVMINQLGTALLNAKMVKRLEEMATTDGLTGLPNHRTFQEELDKKLASASRFNKELSVILCDVDKFKNVNDTYGHPVGDVVLKGLGETLRRNVVRDTDMSARYGGEEFIILCEGTGTEGAVQLGNRIREDLESQVYQTDQGPLSVTISMGVATYPIHARTKEELVERSDAALYEAKEGGRNQVRAWKKEMAK